MAVEQSQAETPSQRQDREAAERRDGPFTTFIWVVVRGYGDGSGHPREAPVVAFYDEKQARRYMALASFPHGPQDILDVVRVPVWGLQS